MRFFNLKKVSYGLLMTALVMSIIENTIAQSVFTQEEAIDYALQSHVKMKIADMEGEDARLAYKEALAIGLPQVGVDAMYNYSFIRPKVIIEDFISPVIVGVLSQTSIAPELTNLGGGDSPTTVEATFARKNQFSVGLNTSVFVFNGNYLKGLKAGKMFMELAEKQKVLTVQDIKTNVTQAYNSVIVTKKNLSILDKNIQNITQIMNETQAMYDNGFVEALDVDRLLLSKELLETEKIKLKRLEQVSKNVLKFQMAYPLNDEIEIVDNLEKDVDIILINSVDLKDDIDYGLRPEHGLLQDAIALDEMDLKRIKAGYLPSVYANFKLEENLQRDALFDSNESGFLPNGSIGISANIPIYDGGDTKAKIQRKKIELEKRQIELAEFDRALALQIFNARTELINVKETFQNTKRSLALSEKIYNKTQIKYKSGVGSSIELSQAESSLYQAQANYINAMYDILVAQTALDIATGKINDK